jgi:hypothetical protein
MSGKFFSFIFGVMILPVLIFGWFLLIWNLFCWLVPALAVIFPLYCVAAMVGGLCIVIYYFEETPV